MGLMVTISSVIAIAAMTCPTMARLVLPPAEYDHPYEGQTVITWKDSAEEVRAACKLPLSMGLGCSHLKEGWCFITLPRTPVLEAAGSSCVMKWRTAWIAKGAPKLAHVDEGNKKSPEALRHPVLPQRISIIRSRYA
jgi:hypothetical protein